MTYTGTIFVLFVTYHLLEGRPQLDNIKRKYPPPEAGFKSLEPEMNMTIDEAIASQLGNMQDSPSQIIEGRGFIRTELDLLLTLEQFAAFHPHESDLISKDKRSRRRRRKAERDSVYRWLAAEVPYVIQDSSFSSKDQYMVEAAMTEWERYTCVRFTPATPSHHNHIDIINGQSCLSQLGMVGGKQELHLQSPGCRFRGLYIHEIGHALGLIHEHQRPDRDNYIDVMTNNIAPQLTPQFYKYNLDRVDLVDTTYEYSSIMHYGVTAFSKDGTSKTIRTKDPAREEEIGKVYLKELSFNDVKAVSNMYKCSGGCPSNLRCRNGGFVSERCQCVCPDGTRDCEVGYEAPDQDGSCSNEYDDWQCAVWANSGQCHRNRKFMTVSCTKACGLCGAASSTEEPCEDVYPSAKCKGWQARGDCVANYDWMNRNCRMTCNACVGKAEREETNCENKHTSNSECTKWAGEGECAINSQWMLSKCQSACQYCHKTPPVASGKCVDLHRDTQKCAQWAQSGECDINPDWMLVNCNKSCGCKKWEPTEGDCEDSHDDKEKCAEWAESGECEANPDWMLKNCKKSCDNCDGTGRCVDLDSECGKWANEGECVKNPDWMGKNCKRSCEKCDPGPGKTLPPTTPKGCRNDHTSENDCKKWAGAGHCDINPSFMHDMCRKACQLCDEDEEHEETDTDTCEDLHDDTAECADWADTGECEANPDWMLINCRKSCGECDQTKPTINTGSCEDLYEDKSKCASWAGEGECEANPDWMLVNCKRSCGRCNKTPTDTGSCEDLYEDKSKCASWAGEGECEANPDWMLVNCKRSCGRCNKTPTDTDDCTCGGHGNNQNLLLIGVVYIVVTMAVRLM